MESTLVFVTESLAKQSLQLIVVFVVALIASRILRGASAHCRYLLWCIVIAKCLTPPLLQMPLALLPAEPATPDVVLTIEPDGEKSPAVPTAQSPLTTATTSSLTVKSQPPLGDSPPPAKEPLAAAQSAFTIRELGMHGWLAIVWMTIAGSLVIFIFAKMTKTHWRLRSSRVPIDDDTNRLVLDVVARLRMRTLPRVYFVEGHTQPFVWGWVRGDIYLTRAFLSATTRQQQKALLAHELAHVARWDLAINLIQMLTSAVFFFHPLVWIANKKIRQEREKCCDEIALSGKSPRAKMYCEAIVDLLASEFQQRPVPGLAATGSVRNIEERITTILTSKRDFRRRPSFRALILAGVSAACLLPTAWVLTSKAATPEADASIDWEKGQVVHVTVVHEKTNAPIPGVLLETQFEGKGIDFSKTETKNTDADGKATLTLPDLPAKSMRIYPAKNGLLPLRCYWEGAPVMKNPKNVTIRMNDGESIGGFIRDEDGEPIANAELKIEYWGPGEGENPHLRANITWNNDVCKREMPKTDENGKWQFDMMPKEIDLNRLYIYLKHPDFVSDRPTRGYSPRPLAKKPSWEDLRSHTSEMVMQRGKTVHGKVVDEAGKPIPNAKIIYNEPNSPFAHGDPSDPYVKSDKNGAFQFSGLRPIEPLAQDVFGRRPRKVKGWSFTVEAKGYASNYVEVTDPESTHTVTLGPGKKLRGQVVDEEGKPIEKAYVAAAKWRGENGTLRRVIKTDADGRFELDDLPDDEIEYDIGKEGYMMLEHHVMSSGVDVHKITLEKPLTVSGSVVDAETGEPLKQFTFVSGHEYNDGRAPQWTAYKKKLIRNGKYEASFDQVGFPARIRIEADGYLPAESPVLDPSDSSNRTITINYKMTHANPINGAVLGLDDKPLPGAKVYMARQRMNLKDRKVAYVNQWDRQFATTDDEGRFSFPAEIEPFCFVVVHEDGLGMVTEKDFAKSPKITIQKWDEKNHQQQIVRRPLKDSHFTFPPPNDITFEGSDF